LVQLNFIIFLSIKLYTFHPKSLFLPFFSIPRGDGFRPEYLPLHAVACQTRKLFCIIVFQINNLMLRTGTSAAFITWIPEKGGLYGEGGVSLISAFTAFLGLACFNKLTDNQQYPTQPLDLLVVWIAGRQSSIFSHLLTLN
jgi:hypothetical protein